MALPDFDEKRQSLIFIDLLYLCGVVGSFLSDINIVGMALLETCTCDSYELSLIVESGDVGTSAVTHT